MENETEIKFTGKLQLDSEKLFSTLKKNFKTEDFQFLVELYAYRSQISSLEDLNSNRSVGADYNPRVARIALLAMAEGHLKELEYISAALALQNSPSSDLSAIKLEYLPSFQLANRLEIRLFELETLPSHDKEETLVLAALLDEIRHLHQENIALEIKKERILKIESYFSKMPSNKPLYQKCMHALRLQKLKFSKPLI